jgi:CHAT domain-containing protein
MVPNIENLLGHNLDSMTAERVFDEIWSTVKNENLMAGQPRSDSSVRTIELGQFALSAAESFGEIRWQAEACSIMAYVLNANESYSDALQYYDRAISNFEELGHHAQAARARLGYMYALLMTGRCRDAIRVGQEADSWFVESGDDIRHARVRLNLGNVYHRLDDHAAAYECYLEAAGLFAQMGDRSALSQAYLNIANVLSSMGRLEESDSMYERAGNLCEELGSTDLLLQTTYNRAYLHFLRGKYSRSLESFSEVRTLFADHHSDRHLALCDLDEAEVYLQLNSPANAASRAKRAAEQFEKLNMRYEQAKAMTFLGLALCKNRQFGEALDVFRSCRSIFHEEGNSYWEAILDLYIAEIMFSLGRIWESRPLTMKAMEQFRQLDVPALKAVCLVLLGRIALEMRQLDRAQNHADEILMLTKQRNIPLLLFPSYVLCAQVAERAGRLDQAREFYELAAHELETHRTRIHHDELRATFFQSKQQIYEALVHLYVKDADDIAVVSPAFNWIERSKSRNLMDLLGSELRADGQNKDQGLLDRITRLREELNSHYLRTRPEANLLPTFTSGHFSDEKESELARNLRELAELDPEYGSLQTASTVSLQDFQSALDADTTVIEYFIARDEVIALVITASQATIVRRLCPVGRVRYLQERVEAQIQKFELAPENARAHEEELTQALNVELHDLYFQLCAPLRKLIATNRLLIVPHGILHLLPFHLFRDEQGYLFERFAISYAPSASIATYSLCKPEIDQPPLIVDAGNTGERSSAVRKLTELSDEFRILEHASATREAFSREAAASSFLVISSEFVFREDNPMLSAFRLKDGWVTAIDLYSMPCQANIIALDGYQSAMRHTGSAEDLLSIARGFMYAGARSVLMPLWRVTDASNADLLGEFYKNCKSGISRPEALIAAMNTIRASHPHPYFWGSLLLFGH